MTGAMHRRPLIHKDTPMTIPTEDRHQFVNDVGHEAFELIVHRMEALGELPLRELLPSVVGAVNVALANALRPAIEGASDRAAAADSLLNASLQQTRQLLDPVVHPPKV